MASEPLPRLRPRVRRRSQAAASRSEDALEGFGPLPTLDEVVDRPDVLEDERCSAPSRRILVVEERQHEAKLVGRLRERPPGPTIVYVTLQRTAEEIAEMLVREGFHARAYHAGLEDDERAAVQDWFMQGNDGIVVATIAFGMGIDKANIRYVYHFNLPKSLENYAQEIGRAGRDGQPATLGIAGDLAAGHE